MNKSFALPESPYCRERNRYTSIPRIKARVMVMMRKVQREGLLPVDSRASEEIEKRLSFFSTSERSTNSNPGDPPA